MNEPSITEQTMARIKAEWRAEWEAEAARTADRPSLREAIRPWLRHKDWCNVKTDDPPETKRCKCGLAAALRQALEGEDR